MLAALASVTAFGCKRQKPPPLVRVWLGASHGCGVTKTGELECWGANDSGQLGDGANVGEALPIRIPISQKPNEMALGARHTCGLFGDVVRCWGDGSRGQLGASPAKAAPGARVTASAAEVALTGAQAIVAAGDRTCALTAAGVRCWGDGRAEPEEPGAFHGRATSIALGPSHVCVAQVEPFKVVRCSGANDRGQLGGGTPLLLNASVTALTAGGQHSCALLEDGTVQCWGANDRGQLGDGTTTDSRTPVLVHGLPPAIGVHAGTSHTCARLRNNTVACWGDNSVHQLVNGTAEPSSKPGPVQGLMGVMELSIAGNSACARTADGGVRCWGANNTGQLGDGTISDHDVPMPIRSPATAAR